VRLLKGVKSPLAGRGPPNDLLIVRENNEGEYSEIGGRLYRGTAEELAVQQSVFNAQGLRPHHALRVRAALKRPRRT